MNTELAPGQNCKVCGVVAEDVDTLWPQIQQYVERAVAESRGECSVEDIREFLNERVMQLWIAYESNRQVKACMVTQLVNYPRKKFLRIVLLSGDGMNDWQYGWDFVETWARHHGCNGVESFARRGFVRQCKALGFREYHTIVGKDFLPLDIH